MANPNAALLAAIRPELSTFDASSFAEVERALAAGMAPERITFCGPAKREGEIRGAIRTGIGELVIESLDEAERANAAAQAAGRVQDILVRINPLKVPRKFGAWDVEMLTTPLQSPIEQLGLIETALGSHDPSGPPVVIALGIGLQRFSWTPERLLDPALQGRLGVTSAWADAERARLAPLERSNGPFGRSCKQLT